MNDEFFIANSFYTIALTEKSIMMIMDNYYHWIENGLV